MKLKISILLCILAVCQVQSQIVRIFHPPGLTPPPLTDRNNVAFFSKPTRTSNNPICSGALIINKWILTAASCFINLNDNQVRFKIEANEIILTGNNDVPHYKDAKDIVKIFRHPLFVERTLANDIALVLIETQSDIVPYDIAVGLPSVNWVGRTLHMRGYGAIKSASEGQSGDLKLNEATVYIRSNVECRKEDSSIPANKLCSLNVRVCRGDQGGPLVLKSNTNDDQIVGIISAFPISQLTCGDNYRPTETFTNVMLYKPWINQITGNKFQ